MNKEENFETMVKLTPLETLDYISQLISDLYEERERLQNTIYKQEDKIEELRALYFSEREVKEEYKSKVNKAIEYIKENETTFNVHNVANAFGIPSLEFTLEPWKKELLDILKGDDKE